MTDETPEANASVVSGAWDMLSSAADAVADTATAAAYASAASTEAIRRRRRAHRCRDPRRRRGRRSRRGHPRRGQHAPGLRVPGHQHRGRFAQLRQRRSLRRVTQQYVSPRPGLIVRGVSIRLPAAARSPSRHHVAMATDRRLRAHRRRRRPAARPVRVRAPRPTVPAGGLVAEARRRAPGRRPTRGSTAPSRAPSTTPAGRPGTASRSSRGASSEGDLQAELRLAASGQVGWFPEQASNRRWIGDGARGACPRRAVAARTRRRSRRPS